jgi:uncharacterized repeat protein (TIGR01451 family)
MKNTKIFMLAAVSMLLSANSAWAQTFNNLSHIQLASNTQPNAPLGGACNAPTLYEQPFDAGNFGTARTSDEEAAFLTSESILDGAGVITPLAAGTTESVRVWGISAEFSGGFLGPCTDDDTAGTPFNVIFSADAAGTPGAVISSVVATATVTDTAIPFAFTTVFQYDLSFPATDITGAAWVSVQRQTGASTPGGNQCLFLWVDETLAGSYDDSADQNGGAVPSDHVYCLGETILEADLAIAVSNDASQPVQIGDQFNYALTVTNNGPGDATGVTAVDTLPANVTYVSNTCGATNAAGVVTWAIGNLTNGTAANCSIAVQVSDFDVISNSATVSGNETDPTPANNTTSANITGQARIIPSLSVYGLILLVFGLLFMVRRQRRA